MSTVTPRVQAILTSLIDIRKRLRSIKSKNDQKLSISDIQEQVEAQAIALCRARDDGALGPETNSKVDAVLDDVYHILSLYRKTPKKAPATVYVQLTTMKQCLDHLESSGIFRLKDLEPYEARLTDLEKMVQTEFPTDDEGRPQHGQQLLIARKLEQCRSIVDAIRDSLKSISPHLIPIQNKLIALKRQLETIAAQRSIRPSDLHPVQDELRKIDTARVDGIWRAPDGSVPAGQSHIRGLMEQLYDETHDLLTRSDTLTDKTLRPIYENLIEIKSRLQYLSLTHRWTMREDDIYYYQAQLQKVDLQRQDGKFHAEDGSVPQGQAVLNSLLNKSYNLVHILLSSVSPVAEPLIAVHNQLLTIRKCLTEVTRYGGPYTAMEVYPFQMKLASIDNMRRDGKFFDDEGNVPEGQGIVHALLSECYDYVYAIRAQIEDEA